ncbi:hypothetical protein [Maledivibacter halophilus]|uniref:Two-component signal transduction system YycFG, regulatory protein YycH n=1 Tax=Maledivibacter halophilus TaxID=36842 RepID=A0A1T5MK50_9FIRM|nr:hypothetical protein [Maledivibacter halophilus]SKC88433.1 Two-component signal transduction system YycFG, regulatory protein YycH [Maledivibacter halophilus]
MKFEKIKSVLLLSLFIVSLILTQRLWFYFPFGGVISIADDMNLEEFDIDVTEILSPQDFIISFGGGDYTVFYSEPYEVWNITKPISNNSYDKNDVWIWKTTKEVLRDYLKSDYEVHQIDYDKWQKINRFKSIRLNFACEIPGNILIDAILDESGNASKIKEKIDTILIPAIEGGSNNIYLGNHENDFYIELKGNFKDNRVRELVDNIEKIFEDKGYINYITLNRHSQVDNDTLIPVFGTSRETIPFYNVKNEIDVTDKASVISQANQFFSSSFDFVKEINEIDGSIIYMYGYGEKTLKINKNGELVYEEKVDNKKASYELDFIDSLKYAVKFVEEKGRWPINRENAYLSDYKLIEKNNKKGYEFSFNYRLKGLPVFIPDIAKDKAIVVRVIGSQITYYKKMVKSPPQNFNKEVKSILSVFDEGQEKKMLDFSDVLRMYGYMIKNTYIMENELEEEKIQDLETEELIERIGLVYYSYQDKLVPAWEVTIDDIVYYFDLYTGVNYTSNPKN